jgi:hypothetical protein
MRYYRILVHRLDNGLLFGVDGQLHPQGLDVGSSQHSDVNTLDLRKRLQLGLIDLRSSFSLRSLGECTLLHLLKVENGR